MTQFSNCRFLKTSPIYWSGWGYRRVLQLVYTDEYRKVFSQIAGFIDERSSVLDVCSGPCLLFLENLSTKKVDYLGFDANPAFIKYARARGVRAELGDARIAAFPMADYVTVCSSLYHFYDEVNFIIPKLLAVSRKALIISEPVRNISSSPNPIVARLGQFLSRSGLGSDTARFDLTSFHDLCARHCVSEFYPPDETNNALAIFRKTGSK